MKPLARLVVIAPILMIARCADAASLSMYFAGGGTEVTLAPSESVTIDVLMNFSPGYVCEKSVERLTRAEMRFDVGDIATNPGVGDYVMDGSNDLSIIDVAAGGFPGWSADGTIGIGGPFNGEFFLSVGDSSGLSGPEGGAPSELPYVIASLEVRNASDRQGDTYVVFRAEDALPALYNGAFVWTNLFGPMLLDRCYECELGRGNPGDADPRWPYHGYETLSPLIIHQVPEPEPFALLTLVALVKLTRQSRPKIRIHRCLPVVLRARRHEP